MGKKSGEKKKKLGKKNRQNRRIPAFVMVRTKRKVSMNTIRRQWRTEKIKPTEKED